MTRNWRIATNRPDAPEGYPYAIVNRNTVVAWVKQKADAQFIVNAESELLASNSRETRYRSLYFSAQGSRHHS